MSQHLVGKNDIDALVTVCLAWGGSPRGEALRLLPFWEVVAADPTTGGARLWRENFENLVFGGDPAELHEGEQASLLEEYLSGGYDDPRDELRDYVFEVLRGEPSAAAGLQVVSYYDYQTSLRWNEDGPTDISRFIDALREVGTAMPGAREASDAYPWGLDDDRDVFLRPPGS